MVYQLMGKKYKCQTQVVIKTTAAVRDPVAIADCPKRTKCIPVSAVAITQANSITSTQPTSNPSQQMTSLSSAHPHVCPIYKHKHTLNRCQPLKCHTSTTYSSFSGSSSVGQPFSVMFLNV